MSEATQERELPAPAFDWRSFQELMHALKPGERLVVKQVMSGQGVTVFHEEAFITPREGLNGALYFECLYPDTGERVTIMNIDNYLWSVEHDQ